MGNFRSNNSSIRLRYIYNVIEMGSLVLHNFPIGIKETFICPKQIKVSFYYRSLSDLQKN